MKTLRQIKLVLGQYAPAVGFIILGTLIEMSKTVVALGAKLYKFLGF